MKVEYLVVTQQDGCFCNSKIAFNNLLQADTQISIEKNKLKFTQKSKTLEVEYGLETNEIKDKKQRYFHIRLVAKDESGIDIFTNLIRVIRKIIERLNSNISINTLWDDISRHYIIQAYPLINEVENVMRKLIVKFMLVNVGMDWIDETMPLELKHQISKKAELNNSNNFLEDALHNADFIQLSGFLFDKKRVKELNQLDNLLSSKDSKETITIKELKKDFLPVSNWDRYFSKLINYEGNLLEKKWRRLYELRNKIAHNKNFSKSELEEVKKLSSEIVGKLNETISELDKVELNEQQKKTIFFSYHQSSVELAYMAETAVFEWYKNSPFTTEVEFIANKGEIHNGLDFIVRLKDERTIGVQVKLLRPDSYEQLKSEIKRGYILDKAVGYLLEQFDEFHIVIVIRKYSFNDNLNFMNVDLEYLLSRSDSKLKLFGGWFDKDMIFGIGEDSYLPI